MVERAPACLRYTNRTLTVARREVADSDCPVKRAATWPRPNREPGALPRLPPVALAALLAWRSTLETKASRSEEHTSDLQSLMRISYAVFSLTHQKSNTASCCISTHGTRKR